MRFPCRAEISSAEPMTDEQIQVFADTVANVPAAIARAPDYIQEKIQRSEEDLRRSKLAGEVIAHDLAKVVFN